MRKYKNMGNNALIVFVRNGGDVKTRIAATTSKATAKNVYTALLNECKTLCANLNGVDVILYFSHTSDEDEWTSIAREKHVQCTGDLGLKMGEAFNTILKKYKKVILIGSDCPYISSALVQEAFDAMENANVVIGPANDGGYYLIGMKENFSFLWENIAWSTDHVFHDTLVKIFEYRKSIYKLEKLSDIDFYDDYIEWKEKQKGPENF